MLKFISQFLPNTEKLFVEFSAPPSVPFNIHSLSSCFICTATAAQLAGPRHFHLADYGCQALGGGQ